MQYTVRILCFTWVLQIASMLSEDGARNNGVFNSKGVNQGCSNDKGVAHCTFVNCKGIVN